MADVILGTLRAKVHGKLRWCLVYPKAGFIKRCDGGVLDVTEDEGDNFGNRARDENKDVAITNTDSSRPSPTEAQGAIDTAQKGSTVGSISADENTDVEATNLDGPRTAPTRAQLRESKKPKRPAAILYLVPLSSPAVDSIAKSLCAIDNELANAVQMLKGFCEISRTTKLSQLAQASARRREIDLTPGTVLLPAQTRFPAVWVSDISRTTDEQYNSVAPRKREGATVLTSAEFQEDMPAHEQTHSLHDQTTVEENNGGIEERPNHDPKRSQPPADGQANVASGEGTDVFLDAEEARRAGRNDARPVPVYDLDELLGAEGVRQLIEGTVFEDARCIVLKESPLSVAAQMALFKLQYYLVDDHV